ncbi:MAG: hypothetical protein CHACPFDD_03694 [Phycisphaerae bacterium]|nr:hypothetical protein [Phycisphaerae bacterium]
MGKNHRGAAEKFALAHVRFAPWTAAGAVFDARRGYRYQLWRAIAADGPSVAFIMLNPSTADASRDDATIRSCWSIARRNGFARLEVVNLFAWRCRNPAELRAVPDPVGRLNDRNIQSVLQRVEIIIAAWGRHGAWLDRDREVARRHLAGRVVLCVGETKGGQPRHPLYVAAGAPLRPFTPRR